MTLRAGGSGCVGWVVPLLELSSLLADSNAQTPKVAATTRTTTRAMMRVRGTVAPSRAPPAGKLHEHVPYELYDGDDRRRC